MARFDRLFDLGQLLDDSAIAFQPENRAAQGREPRFVKHPTPHLGATRVVPARPVKERDVGVVPLAARRDSLMTVAHGLARSQAGQPNGRWDDKKYNQVELRNERVPPPAERPRQHPRRRLRERG